MSLNLAYLPTRASLIPYKLLRLHRIEEQDGANALDFGWDGGMPAREGGNVEVREKRGETCGTWEIRTSMS